MITRKTRLLSLVIGALAIGGCARSAPSSDPIPLVATLSIDCNEVMRVGIDPTPLEQSDRESQGHEDDRPTGRVNLGTCINSGAIEVMPHFSPDGERLYFLRSPAPSQVSSQDEEELTGEDIWFAERDEDGEWARVVRPGAPLNLQKNDFLVAILDDGDRLLIGHGGQIEGEGESAFSFITRRDGGWGPREPLIIEDWHTLTPWITATVSRDGTILVFHAEREDGRGKTDLYATFLQEDGTWSAPLDLGPDINTSGSEITPYLMPDNETLYFSSDGHGGYGGQDIFVTKRLDESWQRWSEPENLGPRFNTPGFDAYFIVPDDSEYGYLASSTGAHGLTDLFQVLLEEPEPTRLAVDPEPVILIHGRVIDEESGAPVGARVHYRSLGTDILTEGQIQSDPESGAFTLEIHEPGLYTFRAEATRYLGTSVRIDATDEIAERGEEGERRVNEYELLLELVPARAGARLVLRNIYFDVGSANLRAESETELANIYELLTENPDLRVEIEGHTDSTGSRALNDRLSQDRAESVRTFLIGKGISPERIEARGYGPTVPIAPNETGEGRQLNRRVELRVLD